MYAQTQYGEIIQDITVPKGDFVGMPHLMDTNNFCVFGIQDTTANTGAALAAQRVFAPNANRYALRSGDGASTFRLTEPGNARGPYYMTTWLAAAQSRFDVGPIVYDPTGATSNTRNTTYQFRPAGGITPSYRSLHRYVRVAMTGEGAGSVVVTHLLNHFYVNLGADTAIPPLVFVFPASDPNDPGNGGSVLRMYCDQTPGTFTRDTVTMRVVREDGLAFSETVPVYTYWDIMVICKPNMGHNSFICPVGTGSDSGQIDRLGGDYDNGDRAIRPRRPGYASAYHHATLAAANPTHLYHNMNAYAQITLVGLTAAPGVSTPFVDTRYGTDGAVGANRVTDLALVGGGDDLDDTDLLTARTYSPIVIGEDNIPNLN